MPMSCKERIRVLVADDDPQLRPLLADLLELGNCEAVIVEDGVAAISRLKEDSFDLIFTDLSMPRASGREVLQAAKSLADPIPVVVMTGQGTEELDDELIALGADACMRKPFELATLLDLVQQFAVDAKRSRGEAPHKTN